MVDFNEEDELRKSYLTYDRDTKTYNRVLYDLYRWYNGKEPVGLDIVLRAASCGMKQKSDFVNETGRVDMKKLVEFTSGILELWNTPISPEPYMNEYPTFEESARMYAEKVGITSAIDAYMSGVPIEDLLA